MKGASWQFEYAPTRTHGLFDVDAGDDVIVATEEAAELARLVDAARALGTETETEVLLDRAPLHWTRLRTSLPLSLAAFERSLFDRGVPVRYVASARHPSQRLAPPLPLESSPPAKAERWMTRERAIAADSDHPHHWFLGESGVCVDRGLCGAGAGTRFAVIDNDAGRLAGLALDATIVVGREPPDPRSLSCHGAALVAWAVGAAEPSFAGVAPGASPRLYCIPKAGSEVVALPLAMARAVFDGADVIACATYMEGSTSPMLDDALEVARRLGRGGLGTAVVVAAGREICSPDRLVPSSLSINLGDPAADPRVLCIGPSGKDGGWFLFHDRRGKLRPFGNRGPSLRFLAPGEDAADPFAPKQLRHTESSGATAFAAGAVLLLLASAPELDLTQLEAVLRTTARPSDPAAEVERITTARASELFPRASDRDGHNAKHGYGRLDAATACCAARDPWAFVLASIGERRAAQRWIRMRARDPRLGALLSPGLGRALVGVLLATEPLRHAAAVVARHLRLLAGHAARREAHTPGALFRHVSLLAREALRASARMQPSQAAELRALAEQLLRAAPDERSELESLAFRVADELWPEAADEEVARPA